MIMDYQEKKAKILSLNTRIEQHMTCLESREYIAKLTAEMVYPRQEFKRKADDLTSQITINWCLVNYAKLSGDKQELVWRWKNELSAHITHVAKMKLKKNDSLEARIKALNEVWVDESEIGKDPETVNMTIYFKFVEERISTNNEVYGQVITNLINEVPNMVYIMAQGDLNTINAYRTKL